MDVYVTNSLLHIKTPHKTPSNLFRDHTLPWRSAGSKYQQWDMNFGVCVCRGLCVVVCGGCCGCVCVCVCGCVCVWGIVLFVCVCVYTLVREREGVCRRKTHCVECVCVC